MIPRFSADTALLLIDVQQGVDQLDHWGGPTGRRNNPGAEATMLALLDAWRSAGHQVAYTIHDSREANSPLKLSLPGGAQKPGFEPLVDDIVAVKDVNSGFVGTSLELDLRRAGITRLVVAGFFTNMCVETTVRMAGNLGYDTYLVHDGCATSNRLGVDGTDHDPEVVHDLSVANMNGEFCTAITGAEAQRLLAGDAVDLDRVQGNELHSPAGAAVLNGLSDAALTPVS
jgi:nicotinamidase-related amidase